MNRQAQIRAVIAAVEFPPEKFLEVLENVYNVAHASDQTWLTWYPDRPSAGKGELVRQWISASLKSVVKYVPMKAEDARFIETFIRGGPDFLRMIHIPKSAKPSDILTIQKKPFRRLFTKLDNLYIQYKATYAALPEKDFVIRAGGFTIHNDRGYSTNRIKDSLKTLKAAAAAIKNAGFGSVLYGDVRLVGDFLHDPENTALGYGVGGWYNTNDDSVYMRVDYKGSQKFVRGMVHEFGHKMWFQSKRVNKPYFEKLYHEMKTPREQRVEQGGEFNNIGPGWQYVTGRGDTLKYVRDADPAVNPQYERPGMMLIDCTLADGGELKNQIMDKDDLITYAALHLPFFPTSYSEKNVMELFAEMFTMYCDKTLHQTPSNLAAFVKGVKGTK